MNIEPTEIRTLLDTGATIGELQEVNGIKVAVVPSGYELKSLERLETYAPQPIRKKGITTLLHLEDFIEFVNKHKTPETLVLVDSSDLSTGNLQIRAIFNFHDANGLPGHADYGAYFNFASTPEFRAWLGIGNQGYLTQEAFVEFLEDNLHTIAIPDGAALKEICASLSARRVQNVTNAFNTQNGDIHILFAENTEIKTGNKEVVIPSEITLGLSPYPGSPNYAITLRLRTRIIDNKLTFGVKWNRLERLKEVILDDSLTTLKNKITDTQVLRGIPQIK